MYKIIILPVWMMGIKRIDTIRAEEITERAGMAKISKIFREARLRWTCGEKYRGYSNEKMEVSGYQEIVRPKVS